MSSDERMPESPENDKKVLDHVLQHVVSFAGAYVLKSKPDTEVPFNYSGFAITVLGNWYIITAGHILEELDEALDKDLIQFTGRVLVNYYGPNAKVHDPTPFDYESHQRIHVYQDGLDFALIALSDFEANGLKANGVIPFTFEGKPERPWSDYDGFAIVGFPQEDLDSDVETKTGPVTLGVRPGLAPVKQLTSAPEGCKITKFPRFVGQLVDPLHPKSIVGMSGGAIIGMKKTDRGLDYWVIAIQSEWLRTDRIVFGCPMPVMFEILRSAVERASSGQPKTTTVPDKTDSGQEGSK